MTTYNLHSVVNIHYEVILGYDPMLKSYFLNVVDETKHDDSRNVLWIGREYEEITDIEVLKEGANLYLGWDLPEEVWDDLRREPINITSIIDTPQGDAA